MIFNAITSFTHLFIHFFTRFFKVGKDLLVSYWGQNSAGIAHPDNPEDELYQVCHERQYDVIVIAFVVTFFSSVNKGKAIDVHVTDHYALYRPLH